MMNELCSVYQVPVIPVVTFKKLSQCIRKIGKDLERMRTNENKVERSMRTPF